MIQRFDDVLPDPHAYRAALLRREFRSVDVGAVFHGITMMGDDPTVPDWLTVHLPGAVPTMSLARQSPLGQVEPNFIHTDCDMGAWTAILYLTPDPPSGDGTRFWRSRTTGQVATTSGATSEANLAEVLSWRDPMQWECWDLVPAAFNRLVFFPAAYYHSRALPENYGEGDGARLIQVTFGTWEGNPSCV